MDGNIFNSRGVRVATVRGSSIFSPTGKKLYDLKGTTNIQAVGRASWASRERERGRKAPRPSNRQAFSSHLICFKKSTPLSVIVFVSPLRLCRHVDRIGKCPWLVIEKASPYCTATRERSAFG